MEKKIRYALIVFVGILAALLVFLFFQYNSLRQEQLVGARQLHATLFLEHYAPLPPNDAPTIVRPWMTFDYINKLFALPPGYLHIVFGIASTSSYPRLTIANYAKFEGASTTVIVGEIGTAIESYAAQSSSIVSAADARSATTRASSTIAK